MNDLPDEFINIPIPLIGLIGSSTLHFYIEKYISNKSVLDFQRIHNSPATSSNSVITTGGGSNTNSPVTTTNVLSSSLDPISISSDNNNTANLPTVTLSSSTGSTTQITSPSLTSDLEQIFSPHSTAATSQQQQQQFTSISSPPPVLINTNKAAPANGWRVQPITLPFIRVLSIEPGSLSLKKEKRPNHSESFVPLGIIKANWIHKHCVSLPSVVTLFIQWPEDKTIKSIEAILTQIDVVKTNIKNRNVRLMIIIVTNTPNIDVYDEKFTLVRRRADIDPKYFLFLNKSETNMFKVFVQKWEKLAMELADQFYKEECQNAKSQITKTTHPFLVIRYHFKIAYYSEFRGDLNTALKYYSFAYNSLKDWKPNNDHRGTRFAELRSVASFLNLKICKIYLWANNLHEAVQQFEKHIKLFKIYFGPSEKEFTHSSWAAKEYQIFAELLEMCPNIKRTLFISNPGIYYQTAAKLIADRRTLFKSISDNYTQSLKVLKYKDSKLRNDLSMCVYIGQPPPEVAHPLEQLSSTQHDHDEESEDFYRSIAMEQSINYTTLIIELLTKAYEQASLSGNFRILSFTESLIASEYFTSKQYDLALKFYNKNAFTYRRERWWTLLTHSLSMILKCVHNLGLTTNYIAFVLDYLSPDLSTTQSERMEIQQNLIYILTEPTKLSPPLSLSSPLDVNIDHTHPLINCRVQFPQSFAFSHSSTEFYVVFESHFPNPIRFSKLKVHFSDKFYDKEICDETPINQTIGSVEKNLERSDLVFLPDESRLFSFKLNTKDKMELECVTVVLELQGSSPANSINFKWNISEWAIKSDETEKDDPTTNSESSNAIVKKKPTGEHQKPDPYKKFLERSSIRILDHESLIQIKCIHNPPAIINEFYEVELELINNDKEITKGTVTFEINNQNQMDKGIYFEPTKGDQLSVLELPHILEKSSFKKKFYIHSSQIDDFKLLINISYETKTNEISHTSKMFTFPVQIEPLLLQADIRTNLPYNVVIEKTTFQINSLTESSTNPLTNDQDQFESSTSPLVAQLLSSSNKTIGSVELSKDTNFSSWFNLIPLITGESISLGVLYIEWRRKNSNTISILPIQLPHVRITTNPFITNISTPSFGVVGIPLLHTITIKNNTNFLQEFDLLIIPSHGTSEAPFLYSGDKVGSFSIHPDSTHEIKHVLLPLLAGKHPLPHFKISSKRFNKELPKTKNSNNFLFVKPNLEWVSNH
eukprot:gene10272-12599_t